MNKRLKYNKARLSSLDVVLPVEEGGTGATSPEGVKAALNIIPTSDKDAPGGVVGLNGQGKIPSNRIVSLPNPELTTVSGPKTASTNSSVNFTIENYSSLYTYTVTSTSGSVNRAGDSITLNTPITAQVVILTIRTQFTAAIDSIITIPVDVIGLSTYIDTPSIVSPEIGSVNLPATVELVSTSFDVINGSDTHVSTDWEIATDSDFTNIVDSSTDNTADKTSYTIANLIAGTAYYARVRYKGSTQGYSKWSAWIVFVTRVNYSISYEQATIQVLTPQVNGYFGNNISISKNGTRMAIGARNYSQKGFVYVYKLGAGIETNTWVQEAILEASDGLINDNFGSSVCMDDKGSRIIVGASVASRDGFNQCGAAYIYRRNGSVWIEEAILSFSGRQSNDLFGSSVVFGENATMAIVGAKNATRGGIASGAVYTYVRNGHTWTQERVILPNMPSNGEQFGSSIAISPSDNKCAIGAPGATVSGKANTGKVYTYNRDTGIWNISEILLVNDTPAGARYGESVAITEDTLIIGSPGVSSNRGSVYFYKKQATWILDKRVDGISSNGCFGHAVSINVNGNKVVASSYNGESVDSVGFTRRTGIVQVFKNTGSEWTDLGRYSPAMKDIGYQYGLSVSMDSAGHSIAIGAPGANFSAGRVHVLN